MAKKSNPEILSSMPSEVQLAFKALRKDFGAGCIKILGDDPKAVDIVGMVPTGSLAIDLAIGAVHLKDGVFVHGVPRGRTMEVYGPESCGKCHAKGTKILMYDGRTKSVEDIVPGNVLMGPDSQPRVVKKTTRGFGHLNRIVTNRGFTDPFIVNDEHILVLKNKEQGSKYEEIREISVAEFVKKSKNYRKYNRLMRKSVEFDSEEELTIDPYFLGLWLGDGSSDSVRVFNTDPEVIGFIHEYADLIGHTVSVSDINRCPGWSIVTGKGKYQSEFCLQSEMRNLGLIGSKRIPISYLTSSLSNRRSLLAGLIDSDGYKHGCNLTFVNTSKELCDDVVYLARSLGFSCVCKEFVAKIKNIEYECKAFKVDISGYFEDVPIKVSRKIPNVRKKNDYTVAGFSVEDAGNGEYYGFLVDGDHRYLTGDFVVHHNTTFCNEVVAHAQDMDGLCAFIDMEQAWDKDYATKIGVDTDALTISQPSCGEEALSILETLVMTRAYDVIIVDSIASLVPQSEIDAAIAGNQQPGTQARMMSSVLRKINPTINASKTCVIFTNQLREKIGIQWGNPETTPGGRAMKFYATLRMEMRPAGKLKDASGIQYGHQVKITLKKNKIAAPYKVAMTELIYGHGFNTLGDIVDLGCQYGIIEKRGAWFSIDGEQVGQGRNNVMVALDEDPALADSIKEKILKAHMGIKDEEVVEESKSEEVETP